MLVRVHHPGDRYECEHADDYQPDQTAQLLRDLGASCHRQAPCPAADLNQGRVADQVRPVQLIDVGGRHLVLVHLVPVVLVLVHLVPGDSDHAHLEQRGKAIRLDVEVLFSEDILDELAQKLPWFLLADSVNQNDSLVLVVITANGLHHETVDAPQRGLPDLQAHFAVLLSAQTRMLDAQSAGAIRPRRYAYRNPRAVRGVHDSDEFVDTLRNGGTVGGRPEKTDHLALFFVFVIADRALHRIRRRGMRQHDLNPEQGGQLTATTYPVGHDLRAKKVVCNFFRWEVQLKRDTH